jgi:hypothetical protein
MSSENLHAPGERRSQKKRRAARHLHDLGDFEQPARRHHLD